MVRHTLVSGLRVAWYCGCMSRAAADHSWRQVSYLGESVARRGVSGCRFSSYGSAC